MKEGDSCHESKMRKPTPTRLAGFFICFQGDALRGPGFAGKIHILGQSYEHRRGCDSQSLEFLGLDLRHRTGLTYTCASNTSLALRNTR